jgi:hypothetical protein
MHSLFFSIARGFESRVVPVEQPTLRASAPTSKNTSVSSQRARDIIEALNSGPDVAVVDFQRAD